MFRFSKLIIHMWTLPWNAQQIRQWFPDASLVHGRMRVNQPVANIHGADASNPLGARLFEPAASHSAQAIYHAASHGLPLPASTMVGRTKPPQRLAPKAPPSLNHSGHATVVVLHYIARHPSSRSFSPMFDMSIDLQTGGPKASSGCSS
jgi:hypothetical protein